MSYIFTTIYDFFATRKAILYILLGILTLLLGAGALRLRYENDINRIIPQDEKISSLSNYLQHTEGGEKMVLSISGRDSLSLGPDSIIQLQSLLADLLDSIAGPHIKSIESEPAGIDEQALYRLSSDYLPLYLTDEDYRELEARLQPEKIQAYFQKQRELLQTPAGAFISQALPQDPLGLNYLALSKFAALHQNSQYSIVENHIFTAGESKLIFFLTPRYAGSDNKRNQELHKAMRTATAIFLSRYPQCDVQYFSGGLIGADNARQMQEDTILTLGITIVLLVSLTWYIFKRKRTGLLLMLPVVFGMLFSLGLLSFFKGTLAIMALGVGAVILGIALDFSIHYLNHAREQTTSREDVRALALPLSLGAFTTIGAFFILNFAQASVLQDVGLFASLALTGASLFTLVFLPHIVDHLRLKQTDTSHKPTFIDKWARWQPEKNKYLVIGIFLLTPVLWYFSGEVKFEGDLMQLNYMSDEMRRAEASFNRDADQSLRVIYAISKDRDADKALERSGTLTPVVDSLQRQGWVQQFVQPSVFIRPSAERQRARQRWEAFWNDARIADAQEQVVLAATRAGMDAGALIPLKDFVREKQFNYSDEALAEFRTLMPLNISNYHDTTAYITTIKVTSDNRKAVLEALGSSPSGLIITDRQSIAETLISYIREDFNNLVFYSGALVFLALLIVYGRLELALMSFLPMAISWIWILGIMGIFHIEFNIVNIIICTLIFGLGDDYCIFMMDGLIEKYKTGHNKILISRSAIYVSALTTIIGLGVLIFAKHPALKSIALIAVLGIACVVMISQVLQPFLFGLFIQKRADKGLMPFTLWSFSKMIFAFTYFVVGCLVLTLVGSVLVYLNPLGRERGKKVVHFLISRYIRSLINIMGNVSKTYHYTDKDYHKKPAVYIANHTSFLDILIMTSLHPKVILITADWVWKSPVMGPLVRMADYYPAAEGAQEGLTHLRTMRDKGYSIVIFPEGTRSYTDRMGKFRKGAFYLAEQLQMDIQPLVLHGVQYTMEKGDFLLKNGHINVHVEDRIRWDDPDFGHTVADRRKLVSQWFRQRYRHYKNHYETPAYFRETLIKSHIYKGPVLEWYCRIKTKLENNYEQYHTLLPREGRFYDLGCGYGFMTFMLHWSAPGRKFIGIDYDEDKIATAQNNYYFNTRRYRELYSREAADDFEKGLSFSHGDLTKITLQPCNGILLMDALHYLLPEEQDTLLQACYDALLPGGVLILRDGVKEDREKHEKTRLTELFSTRILRFNKTRNTLHFISREQTIRFFEQQGAHVACHNYSRNLSNHTFIITKPVAVNGTEAAL